MKIEEEKKEGRGKTHLYDHWAAFLKDIQIKVGTLLKSDSVSFFLGAGASKNAGGVLLGTIPVEIENQLLKAGVDGKDVKKWIEIFYVAANRLTTNPFRFTFICSHGHGHEFNGNRLQKTLKGERQ
ncbi:MAG: hypothetical protein A2V86_03715 [Deltaproteobacteria bacterium RBG_16_49_23]|nr:MAG: hypothetical protein A2V86_03715 [Deltaproteobacteria bacterium RBG_16_49_23]